MTNEEYLAQREAHIKEQQKFQEEQRQQAFKWVKKAYQSRSAFERLKIKLNGKAPNWKKISNYSKEELDFLRNTLQGNTHEQIFYERGEDAYHGLDDPKGVKERIGADRWDRFVTELASKDRLNGAMEIEDMYAKKEGRRR